MIHDLFISGTPMRTRRIVGAALVACAVAVTAGVPKPALAEVVAEYSFDDGTAQDTSGHGHDGTIVGDPATVAGFEGNALKFDGLDDYVVVADHADLEPNVFTITVWLRIGRVPNVDTTILDKWEDDRGYRLIIGADTGVVRFELGDGLGEVHVVDAPFRVFENVWTAVTVTYDGVALRLYLDGSLVREVGAGAVTGDNDADLIMAASATQDGLFAGALDAVRIEDTAASEPVACAQAKQVWDSANNLCAGPFVDVAFDLGVDNDAQFGFGACLVDIDQDGWLDLYYVNGSENPIDGIPGGVCPDPDELPDEYPAVSINALFMNNGDGTFTEDVAPEMGLDDGWNAMRNVFGDYDNNGLRDMFSHNFIVSTMYRAVSGPDPMHYEDWNDETGVHICLPKGTGSSWVDLNFDGWLDLYVVEYFFAVPPEDNISYLYLNDGDGTFTEVTAEAGMDLPQNAMGITFADYDNDGDQDVFLTNSPPAPTRLYRHDGVNADGIPQFTDVAEEAGVAVDDEGSLGVGVGWGDYNNDGYLDLLFSRTTDSRLWRNDGPDGAGIWRFTDVTGQGGFDVTGYNLWGGNFADLDNDGWLDIMLTNRDNHAPNLLFMNNRDGTWREVAEFHGMDMSEVPQLGFVAGDIDNDGDLDVVLVTHESEPSALFRNDGRGNNWIQFDLEGTVSNRDAVGSRITLTAAPQPGEPAFQQIREVQAGTGFFSDFPRIQTFGLGKAAVVEQVHIDWPNGEQLTLVNVPINQRLEILEGAPPPDPILAVLSITGPAVVTGTGTYSFVANAEYYYSVPGEETANAAWSVEPGDYAQFIDPGKLTVSAVPANQTVQLTASLSGFEASMSVLIQPADLVDTSPPTLTVAQGGSITTEEATVVLNGTAEDDLGVVVSVMWSIDHGAGGPCTGLSEWSTGAIALLDGANVITVRATDNADNESSMSIMVERVEVESEPDDPPEDPDPIDEEPSDPEEPITPDDEEPVGSDEPPSTGDEDESGDIDTPDEDPTPIEVSGPALSNDNHDQTTQPTASCGVLGLVNLPLILAGLCAIRRRAA